MYYMSYVHMSRLKKSLGGAMKNENENCIFHVLHFVLSYILSPFFHFTLSISLSSMCCKIYNR